MLVSNRQLASHAVKIILAFNETIGAAISVTLCLPLQDLARSLRCIDFVHGSKTTACILPRS